MFSKGQEKSRSPQPIESNFQGQESEDRKGKRRDIDIDKDTKRWVEEQNTYFKRSKEKLKGETPPKPNFIGLCAFF